MRLFKRKKVDIHAISFPNFDWNKREDKPEIILWVNPEQSTALSINFFDIPPDLPSLKDIQSLRNFYRGITAPKNIGIIQVDLLALQGNPAVKTIFKVPQDPHGMSYMASLTIPYKNCSFVIKIQALETGMTGARDSLLLAKLLASGEITMKDQKVEGWFYDPYDPNLKEGVLMNQSEQEKYDPDFPEHPLSQARSLLHAIEKEIVFGKETASLKSFDK